MSGGSSPAPVQDNSLQVAQFQAAQAQQAQAAADAKAAADETKFQTNLSTAAGQAKTTGATELTNLGLDPTKYSNIIDQAITTAQNSVPDLSPNPGQYFDPTIFDTGVTNAQNQARVQNTSKVNSAFAPGFEDTLLPSSSVQPTIDDILNQQYNTAQQQVDYNRKRGTINDQGYATAEQKLAASKAAGASSLNSIGQGVLGSDTQGLDQIRTDAGTAANEYTLGGPEFDVTPYQTKANTQAQTDLTNLGGDVTNAVGSTNFFDIPTILAQAGIAQGPQNLTTIAPTTSGPGVVKKNPNADRGLGSTGSF